LIGNTNSGGVDLINIINSKFMTRIFNRTQESGNQVTNLAQAKINREHIIKEIKTNDEEIKNFLFTLGCYEGEAVTVISILSGNYVIAVKDARYSIDKELAEAIIV
jgi:Fe2+ transport system protein FeoA